MGIDPLKATKTRRKTFSCKTLEGIEPSETPKRVSLEILYRIFSGFFFALSEGVEPPTSRFVAVYSIQLSYESFV